MKGKALNVLILKRSGTCLAWVIRHCMKAFGQLGHSSTVLDLDQVKEEVVLRERILRLRPNLVLANNHMGLNSQLCEELKIPHACWLEEDPFYWVRKKDVSPYRILFVYDKAYIPRLKGMGFKEIHFLPLSTDPEHFKEVSLSEEEIRRYGCELSFAGGSYYKSFEIIEDLLGKWGEPKIRMISDETIRFQSNNLSLHIWDVMETFQHKYKYPIPFADEEGAIMFGRLLAGAATSLYRGRLINSLNEFDFHLYGDEGWKNLLRDGRIKFYGSLPYEELPRLFTASKINLNLTTTPIKTSLTQRPFDVLACGGFVLSDYRQDIQSLLEIDKEIVYFRAEEELKEKIDYFLKHPRERREIAKRGQRRVLGEHTYKYRMERLVRVMREIFG
ncbi:TPA: hypothetical protein DCX15_02255 [bacterium]|nr:hypothetical protein [bacterium]